MAVLAILKIEIQVCVGIFFLKGLRVPCSLKAVRLPPDNHTFIDAAIPIARKLIQADQIKTKRS